MIKCLPIFINMFMTLRKYSCPLLFFLPYFILSIDHYLTSMFHYRNTSNTVATLQLAKRFARLVWARLQKKTVILQHNIIMLILWLTGSRSDDRSGVCEQISLGRPRYDSRFGVQVAIPSFPARVGVGSCLITATSPTDDRRLHAARAGNMPDCLRCLSTG